MKIPNSSCFTNRTSDRAYRPYVQTMWLLLQDHLHNFPNCALFVSISLSDFITPSHIQNCSKAFHLKHFCPVIEQLHNYKAKILKLKNSFKNSF